MKDQKLENTGFQIGLEEREVRLIADQNGKDFVLKHFLNQPIEKNWFDYEETMVETEGRGRKAKIKTKLLRSRVQLYNKLVIRVEGYIDVRGEKPVPLNCKKDGWKSQIPALHKSEVIETFARVNQFDEEDAKN